MSDFYLMSHGWQHLGCKGPILLRQCGHIGYRPCKGELTIKTNLFVPGSFVCVINHLDYHTALPLLICSQKERPKSMIQFKDMGGPSSVSACLDESVVPISTPQLNDFRGSQDLMKRVAIALDIVICEVKEQAHRLANILNSASTRKVAFL